MNIEMEFTSTRTPELNTIVERPFTFLWNRIRSMLNREGFDEKMRNLMWSECENMAVQLDNSHIRSHGESNHELYYGKETKY